ncbi:MAG: FG-GAP-like repeat-containing protein [Candidatus Hinthialibacter antarcticus]|nr:FG-GAP-like repeat-containing protein [Candidatus Hinthialibacter antarcticus]
MMRRCALYLFCAILFSICALEVYSQNAGSRIAPLIQTIEDGNPTEAIERLTAINGPFSAQERTLVLQTLSRIAPGGEWVLFLRELCARNPKDADYRYTLARTCWRSGDDKAALFECEAVLELAPNDPLLLYRIAAIAYAANEYPKAKEWLNRLLEVKPNDLNGLLLLGTLLARDGEDDAARKQLLRVIELDSRNYLAYFELGKLANRVGDSEEAERYLRAAIEGYPFFREAVNALLVALSRQKKIEELQQMQEIFEHLRQWPEVKLNRMLYAYRNPAKVPSEEAEQLVIELSQVKRPDLAERYTRYRMDKGLASLQEKLLLSRLYYNEQDYKKTIKILDALAPEEFGQSLLYVYLRTLTLMRVGRMPEAQAFYKTYAPNFPDSDELQSIGAVFQEALSSAGGVVSPKDYAIRFVDVSQQSGLQTFQHILGSPEKPWITDAMGSGVAVGDYDNDGDDDIYFANGRPQLNQPDEKWRNALFRNDGGTFVDVTGPTGVGDLGFGMACLFGDVNNDGWLDLFVGNIGANALYINNGDGTFLDATKESGLDDQGYCAAAAFVDIDHDGDLDLYVGNYIEFDEKADGEKRFNYHGEDVFVGPLGFDAQPDLLYINDGKGAFTNKAKELGLPQEYSRAMGSVFFDIENDGDLDLYITNDSTYNTVLENQGDGHFNDVSFPSGGAFTESGVEGASMGIGPGDFNNDGFIDLYITSYERQTDVLFQNQGNGFLTDVTSRTGLASSRMLITWGVALCDFDANGWLDVFTANGHMYPQVRKLDIDLVYEQGASFYKNSDGRFEDVSDSALHSSYKPESGRGAALLDFDNDGDMDVVINNMDASPTLLENRSPHGAWLQVKLDATSAQSYGVRVVARKGDQVWMRLVDGGSGYLSQNSSILHFGFGDVKEIDSLTIDWRHLSPQVIESPSLNQRLVVSPGGE